MKSPTKDQEGRRGLGTERQYICCTVQSALDVGKCFIFWSQLLISKKISLSVCEPLTIWLQVAGDWLAVTLQRRELKTPANLWCLLTLEWKPSGVPKKCGSTSLRWINIKQKATFVPRMQRQRKAYKFSSGTGWEIGIISLEFRSIPRPRVIVLLSLSRSSVRK